MPWLLKHPVITAVISNVHHSFTREMMYKTQSLSEKRVGFEGSASELMDCSHTTADGAGMAGTYREDTVPVFFCRNSLNDISAESLVLTSF